MQYNFKSRNLKMNTTLKRTSGICVPFAHPSFANLKETLKFKGVTWDNDYVEYNLYCNIDENRIMIPRFYPIDGVVDNIIPGDNIDIQDHIVPRNERQKLAIDFLCNNKNGILKLEPGSGKTVIAISAISKVKEKTLIFIHKDSLRKNWYDEFLKHTNIKEEDIFLLSTSPKKYKDGFQKPIIISTIQSFVSGIKKKDFINELNKYNFGIVIFDECHTTVGPEKFSLASLNIKAYRIFGLSATPIRFDMGDILKWHLGNITYFEPEKDELIKPIVYVCYFPFGIFSRYHKYLMWGGRFQYTRYYKQMIKIPGLLEFISKFIVYACNIKRNILVLGHNIDSLIQLAKSCQLPKEDIGIFTPGATEEQKQNVSDTTDIYEAFFNKKVVFSTYGAGRDGNNKPTLDYLLMLTPTSNVEQAGGRILRYVKDKPKPIIIDLVDTEGPKVKGHFDKNKQIGLFSKAAEKRMEIYEELGWEIKFKDLRKEKERFKL